MAEEIKKMELIGLIVTLISLVLGITTFIASYLVLQDKWYKHKEKKYQKQLQRVKNDNN